MSWALASALTIRRDPYPERADEKEWQTDAMLLQAWGHFSTRHLSQFKRRPLQSFVDDVEAEEPSVAPLSDAQLLAAAESERTRLAPADARKLQVRSFALTREAARRHVGKRLFPVQLLGGAAMMTGALAEMETGEGKSLTALLPAVTAGLSRRPVHIITVNDYLARRDAELCHPIFAALGLTVGLIQQGQDREQRRQAYLCDVTYCSNKELTFDYLKDRLALSETRSDGRSARKSAGLLLRGLHFAIVDEADSVLIDEARTPLILSGAEQANDDETVLFHRALELARDLAEGIDFRVLPAGTQLELTEEGRDTIAGLAENEKGLWSIRRAREELILQALTASKVYRKDIHYLVANDKVQIIDEYTGRVMPDRSWERGLHQMIEAKEGCTITGQRRTLARMTYQRFFRRYIHLCGMTGTASEVAGELRAVYGLDVIRIPTNRPVRRCFAGARIFRTEEEKWQAVGASVAHQLSRGRAVLVGTRSVKASERLADLLRSRGLGPVILNARQDSTESGIISQAGQPGRLVVATNMAGRGTDIVLHPHVLRAGGLHVILTEYHESGRIDRQLFGRCGRQGDPGTCEAVASLEDDLFWQYGSSGVQLDSGLCVFGRSITSAWRNLLRRLAQWSAERQHRYERNATLTEDKRLASALGFAGKGE